MAGTLQEIRQSISVEDLAKAAKRAQRWTPGPGSLRGISMPPMLIEGDYCCPHRMCARRARPGPDWAEPRCVDGTPMLLRPA